LFFKMKKMEKILIGVVVKPRGIKGEIKVKPYTQNIDNLLKVKSIYIDDIEYKVMSAKEQGGMLYLYLSRIYTMDDAQALSDKDIYIDKEYAAPLGDDEYYIIDVLGCDVFVEGVFVGKVVKIDNFGAADVYTVKGDKTVRFPFLKKLVKKIDIKNKKIILNKDVFGEVSVYED